MIREEIREGLLALRDGKYREFQLKLVPNIDPETMIGIRTPELKKYAKCLAVREDISEFLNDLPHRYYEENLLHFFIISAIKNFDECIKELEKFLPYVNCWPVSDQSSPGVFKKKHDLLLPYIRKWIASDHVYTARYGMRILMNEFLDDDFKEEYLKLVADKKGEDYYLKMMVAWYFATALAKQYDATVPYIEERKLDPWVHNKTIQKAVESYRISDEHKEHLKSLKIKD